MLVALLELLIFGLAVAATIALANGLHHVPGIRRRLRQPAVATPSSADSVLKQQESLNPVLRWVKRATADENPKTRQKLIRDLSLAGFDRPSAPIWYTIVRFLLAICLPLAYLLFRSSPGQSQAGASLVFWALALSGVGLYAPRSFIDRRAEARRAQLEREFPDVLDLLVVCMEAGLGLESAFVRVAHEMRESHPRIAEEFARVSEELRAGRGRAEALRAMAERAGVTGVTSFAALVIQTEALGVSVGQTLRTYSGEMRETRFLKAEERAMRIPVLMTVPLIACILPVIITALLLPPVIDVIRTVLPALAGNSGGG
jgi:tight adherence protein C